MKCCHCMNRRAFLHAAAAGLVTSPLIAAPPTSNPLDGTWKGKTNHNKCRCTPPCKVGEHDFTMTFQTTNGVTSSTWKEDGHEYKLEGKVVNGTYDYTYTRDGKKYGTGILEVGETYFSGKFADNAQHAGEFYAYKKKM